MKNITTAIEGNDLVIRVDLTKNLGESATGKSINVASSGGFQPVEGGKGGLKLNLNVCLPVAKK